MDVLHSDWDCLLEEGQPFPVVRLGLRLVRGLGREQALRISKARHERLPLDANDLARRAGLDTAAMRELAAADALLAAADGARAGSAAVA